MNLYPFLYRLFIFVIHDPTDLSMSRYVSNARDKPVYEHALRLQKYLFRIPKNEQFSLHFFFADYFSTSYINAKLPISCRGSQSIARPPASAGKGQSFQINKLNRVLKNTHTHLLKGINWKAKAARDTNRISKTGNWYGPGGDSVKFFTYFVHVKICYEQKNSGFFSNYPCGSQRLQLYTYELALRLHHCDKCMMYTRVMKIRASIIITVLKQVVIITSL